MKRYFRIVVFTNSYELYTKWMDLSVPVLELLKFIDYVRSISIAYDIQYSHEDEKGNIIIEEGRWIG